MTNATQSRGSPAVHQQIGALRGHVEGIVASLSRLREDFREDLKASEQRLLERMTERNEVQKETLSHAQAGVDGRLSRLETKVEGVDTKIGEMKDELAAMRGRDSGVEKAAMRWERWVHWTVSLLTGGGVLAQMFHNR
ncbi:MAG TPA: hypothetical protein VFA12_20010 [Stellaceae bacterium]|nr:hypothetical protein [Stellaceae bacterium]